MVTLDAALAGDETGIPAHVEVRMGLGSAWTGSRFDGALFVVVDRDVADGIYSDDEIERLIASGRMVEYGDVFEGNKPAAELGVRAAVELFLHGAAEMERSIVEGGRDNGIGGAIRPITLAHLGQARSAQGADFVSLGRVWALVERARGLRPFEDMDATEVARQTFADVVDFEREPGEQPPPPRRIH